MNDLLSNVRRCQGFRQTVLACLGLLLVMAGVVGAENNQPVNTLPSATSTLSTYQTYMRDELPAVMGRYFPQGWVRSGGTHATAGTCTSAAFSTEAFTSAGKRVLANSAGGSAAIDYSAAGCNCSNPGSDIAWVIASAASGSSLGNFQRVTGTNYFVNCTDAAPSLPADSAWLLKTTITNGTLATVERRHVTSAVPPGMVDVRWYGATPDDDSDDDVNGWQRAIDSGNPLWCEGTYRFATITQDGTTYVDNRFLTLTSNLTILGGRNCVLKIGDNILSGATDATSNVNIFYGTNVQNIRIEGITFDHNGQNNLTPSGKTRTSYGVKISCGQDVWIQNNFFYNTSGHNYVLLHKGTGCALDNTGAHIVGNTTRNGGLYVGVANDNNADFTALYSEWDSTFFLGNDIACEDIDQCMKGDRAGIEIHGSNSKALGNTIKGLVPGIWIASTPDAIRNPVVSGNTFEDVLRGIAFWTGESPDTITNAVVTNNVIKLNRSTTRAGTDPLLGITHPSGSTATYDTAHSNGSAIDGLLIANNIIDSALSLADTTYPGIGIDVHSLKDAQITGNIIRNMPSECMRVLRSPWGAQHVEVAQNQFWDCGRNAGALPGGAGNRSAIRMDFTTTVPTTPNTANWIKEVYIRNNTWGNTHTETFDNAGGVATINSNGYMYAGVQLSGLSGANDNVERLVIENNTAVNLPYNISGGSDPYVLEGQHTEAHYRGRHIVSTLRPLAGKQQLFKGDTVTFPDGWQQYVATEGWVSAKTGTGDGSATTKTFVVTDASELRVGMVISIAGAGPAGVTLPTKILKIASTTLTLEDTISTTVSGAAFTIVNPTFSGGLVTINLATNASCSVLSGSEYVCNWANLGGRTWHLGPNGVTLAEVTNMPDGERLTIVASTPTVTIKYDSAKIRLAGATDYTLSDANYTLSVYSRSGVLIETARSHAQ